MIVKVEDGKYTYVFYKDGRSEVLRYGEPWRDTCGDKFIYCLASELDAARKREEELLAVLGKAASHVRPTCFELYEEITSVITAHKARKEQP